MGKFKSGFTISASYKQYEGQSAVSIFKKRQEDEAAAGDGPGLDGEKASLETLLEHGEDKAAFDDSPEQDMNEPLLSVLPAEYTDKPLLSVLPVENTDKPLLSVLPAEDVEEPLASVLPEEEPLLSVLPAEYADKPLLSVLPVENRDKPLLSVLPAEDVEEPLASVLPEEDADESLLSVLAEQDDHEDGDSPTQGESSVALSDLRGKYENRLSSAYNGAVRLGKSDDVVFPSAVPLRPQKEPGVKKSESYAQNTVARHVSTSVAEEIREQSKQKRCKVLAVANQKGGVGKTTTTLTLGASLARMGKKILLVDLDPHACTSIHLKLYPGEQDTTLYDLFLLDGGNFAELWERLAIPVAIDGIDAAAGHIRLSELEFDLRDRVNKGMILNEALRYVRDEYDYILLDCPPHVGILLVNALVACDLLIIPIQTDFLALHGLKLLFDTIRTLNKVLPEPVRYRALPTMYDRRARACKRVLDLMRHKMGNAMFDTVVGVDTRFREASALGCSIYDIDPETQGARAYDYLAEEVINLW